MRRSLVKLVAVGLLALVLIQPREPESPSPPIVASSVTPQTDWSGVARARDERLWNETLWLLTVAEQRRLTRASTLEGNQRAMAEQEAEQYDGDRFDRLAQCESGGDPTTNTGNGFFGAFQFMLASWHSAGGTGYPHEHSYGEQKSIAMYWASITNPARQWPVCWPRSA